MATWGPTGIAETADDGYQTGTGGWATNGIFLGNDGSSGLHGGFRFVNVTVPAESTINSATLTIHARTVSGTVTNVHLTFRGDDTDDAPAWSNTSGQRPADLAALTTAAADFDPTAWVDGTDYSYTITDIIAEIIARAGWASGNDIRIALLDDSSTAGTYVRAYDYGDGDAVVRLTIDYTEAIAGVTVLPSLGATVIAGIVPTAAQYLFQHATPIADVADGGWVTYYVTGLPGNNVNMYLDIDDGNGPDDTNMIRSGLTPENDTMITQLSPIVTPEAGTVTIKVRARYC